MKFDKRVGVLQELIITAAMARAFEEVYDVVFGWYPKEEVITTAGLKDEDEMCMNAIRQKLRIEEVEINGLVHWRWGWSGVSPEEVSFVTEGEIERIKKSL